MHEPAHDPLIPLPALLGLALRPLPLLPLQLALQHLVSVIARRHPGLHERLLNFEGRCIGIDPSDLPFAILLEPRHNAIAARIGGPLLALMGLVNGTYDADALFFSRDITITGDIEAALALRNAIDDAEINLVRETAACLPPLVRPLPHSVQLAMTGCVAALMRRQWIVR
jgi:predicted lipid carrier protein YhbT